MTVNFLSIFVLLTFAAGLAISKPSVDYSNIESVIDTSDGEELPVCETELSKVTFSCCFYNVDIRGENSNCFNTEEGDEGCQAPNDWNVNEDSCNDVDFTFRQETPDWAECSGQKVEEDPSSNFTWHCDKPDPTPQQTTVTIEPEVGETHETMFNMEIICDNAFPRPVVSLELGEGDTADITGHEIAHHTGLDGYVKRTDSYRLRIKAAKADMKATIQQEGFETQTVSYTVSYPEFDGDDNGASSAAPVSIGILLSFGLMLLLR